MATLKRRVGAYTLLAPGTIWLVVFFLVPLYFLGRLSLNVNVQGIYYPFNWHWKNYSDALSLYDTQFVRSFIYSIAATVICLLLAYPLAYAIAFKAGKWRHAMLLAVVAPFFTTYLIRTISWVTILSDESPVVEVLKFLQIAPSGHILATPAAVISGLVYNYLPFMVLPIYASLERLDVRLLEAAKDLYANTATTFLKVTLPLSAPGVEPVQEAPVQTVPFQLPPVHEPPAFSVAASVEVLTGRPKMSFSPVSVTPPRTSRVLPRAPFGRSKSANPSSKVIASWRAPDG